MKKLWKDKRGSSLVLVLVCMTFIILLAGAVITMTITNMWLKTSQKKTQENFYKTDSVLDSVAAGIQNVSSKGSSQAYAKALAGYNASLTAADDALSKQYNETYLEYMVKELSGGSENYAAGTTDYHFSDSVLISYIPTKDVSAYISHPSGTGDMVLEGDSLILKDVSVYKQEASGDYETTLTTDIRIDVPLVNTDAHSEYLDYAILADDQIQSDGAKTTIINGNIYAGTVNRDTNQEDTLQGIRITNSGTMTVNAKYIISRGDIALSNHSTFKVAGDPNAGSANIWVENILTGKGLNETGGNYLELDAICNVADDMELNGTGDSAKLTGSYFGYNYNSDYSDQTQQSVEAAYSSAISVNGQQDALDLTALEKLVLSGRTFISKKANSTAEAAKITTAGQNNTDIALGESLTVKSSQLAYYVPADYVKSVNELGTGNYTVPAVLPGEGSVTDGSNPARDWLFFLVGSDVYAFDYQSYNEYVMPDDTTYQTALGNASAPADIIHNQTSFDIRDYIGYYDTAQSRYMYSNAMPLKVYYRHDETISATPIKYFYLNFEPKKTATQKTDKRATIFYSVFHEASPQQTGVYDEVDKRYLSSNGIQLDAAAKKVLLNSGNILYSDPSNATARMKVKLQNIEPTTDSIMASYATAKSKEYMSRQMALVPDYSDAMSSPLWRLTEQSNNDFSKSGKNGGVKVSNLFNKLVDVTKLADSKKVENINGTSFAYITSTGNFEWPPSDAAYTGVEHGIIIAAGDVTIKRNFNGLIIAGGDVNIGVTGVTINANQQMVETALKMDKAAATPMIYNLLSKYFRKSVDATIGNSGAANVNNVNFENWKKNG